MKLPALHLTCLLLCILHLETAQGTGDQNPAKEKKDDEDTVKKEKTDEITEDKHVLVLHDKNFERALQENQYLFVEFYAPWCRHCQALEPVFAEVAAQLKNEGSAIRLAKVDAIEEQELAKEFDVKQFPTLRLFKDGNRANSTDFAGNLHANGLVQWVKRHVGPSAVLLKNEKDAQELIDSHNVVVVGFFKNLKGEKAKEFYEVALKLIDLNFGITKNSKLFKKYAVEKESVVLFKKFDDKRADLPLQEDKVDKQKIINFIQFNRLELVIPFNDANGEIILSLDVKKHLLLFMNYTTDSHLVLLNDYADTARKFREKITFIKVDINDQNNMNMLQFFGISPSDAPVLRLIDVDAMKKYAMSGSVINKKTLKKFCQDALDGILEPFLKSQEIPEDWDEEPVKVLVGKNFDQIAFDKTKNVFVEFYAPWCGHCKQLAPVWEELGEKYENHKNIVIAKMDATANEVEAVTVHGYPTLMYFPAGPERKVLTYDGKTDLKTFIQYLENGGVLPKEKDDQVSGESQKSPDESSSKDEL